MTRRDTLNHEGDYDEHATRNTPVHLADPSSIAVSSKRVLWMIRRMIALTPMILSMVR
jgi:hypothetical protein